MPWSMPLVSTLPSICLMPMSISDAPL